MKKILIQDKSANDAHLDTIRDLTRLRLNNDFEIETTYCLSKTKFDITQYNLIISHPNVYGDCCIPYILKAKEKNIPIIFTYKMDEPEQKLQFISDKFNIELRHRNLGSRIYSDLIKSLEGKF